MSLTTKQELLRRLEALEFKQRLFPASSEQVDALVKALEDVNPTDNPLSPHHNLLSGSWDLIYASRGTVVTRSFASIPDFIEREIKINRIWQTLVIKDNEAISTTNSAEITLPLLGTWQIEAEGYWTESDGKTAKVSFSAFTTRAINPFNISWTPELKIPVLEFLRNEALWITSYLDDDLRIGRGATGNLFVFLRNM
ncbi:fibrillin [Calothrix sp. NIES-4071]|nr:fibrillin [Calothrix sp. NIES-4071]BAZ63276.1 fibrillin [Calothrix sp. NIES-4105]